MTGERGSYAVPTETIPRLDLSHHLQDLIEIRTFFESRGIETKNTRIERYANYFERLLGDSGESLDPKKVFKTSDDKAFRTPGDWFLYVLREVHELMWI